MEPVCKPSRDLTELHVAADMLRITETVLRALLATYGIEVQRNEQGKEAVSGIDLRRVYDRAGNTG